MHAPGVPSINSKQSALRIRIPSTRVHVSPVGIVVELFLL